MTTPVQKWMELRTPAGRQVRVLTRVHPRARRLSLSVGIAGPQISTPRGTHPSEVKAFLRENAAWLEHKLRELERSGQRLAPPEPGRRDTLLWRGTRLPVRWEHATIPHVRIEDGSAHFALQLDHPEAEQIVRRVLRSFVVAQMRREVAAHVRMFEPMIGKPIVATRLLPLKSLWGSLSLHARMTLDLALMLAPPQALEYVVAHEMSHLWIRNHGRRFWERVEAIYPDCHETRDWLSRHGHSVKAELARWIGAELSA